MLANALFLGIYFLTPLASILILYRAGFSFTRLSIPLLFFATYVVFAYVGILPMYYKLDTHALGYGVTDTNIMWQMLLLSSASLLMAAIGTSIALHWDTTLRIAPQNISALQPLSGKAATLACVLAAFCFLVTAVYIANVPKLPLFLAMAGEQTAAIAARASALTTNKVAFGKDQYFNVFIRFLAPFLSYVLLAQMLASKKTLWKILYTLIFVMTAFGLILNTGKGLLLSFMVGNLLVFMYALRVIISPKILLSSGAGFIAVASFLVRFGMNATDRISDLFLYVVTRITVGSMVSAYFVLDMFQNKDLLMGLSFPNPRGILPYKQYYLEQEVWLRIQKPHNPDLLYNAPSVFWSDMYVNFGVTGPLIASLFIGLALGLLNSFLERMKFGPVRVALVIWLGLYYMDLAVRSMFAYAWDYNMGMVIITALAITYTDRKAFQQSAVHEPALLK